MNDPSTDDPSNAQADPEEKSLRRRRLIRRASVVAASISVLLVIALLVQNLASSRRRALVDEFYATVLADPDSYPTETVRAVQWISDGDPDKIRAEMADFLKRYPKMKIELKIVEARFSAAEIAKVSEEGMDPKEKRAYRRALRVPWRQRAAKRTYDLAMEDYSLVAIRLHSREMISQAELDRVKWIYGETLRVTFDAPVPSLQEKRELLPQEWAEMNEGREAP